MTVISLMVAVVQKAIKNKRYISCIELPDMKYVCMLVLFMLSFSDVSGCGCDGLLGYGEAKLVFKGVVKNVQRLEDSIIHYQVLFEVLEVMKGDITGKTIIVEPEHLVEAACGIPFTIGEKYEVYTFGKKNQTNFCCATHQIERIPVTDSTKNYLRSESLRRLTNEQMKKIPGYVQGRSDSLDKLRVSYIRDNFEWILATRRKYCFPSKQNLTVKNMSDDKSSEEWESFVPINISHVFETMPDIALTDEAISVLTTAMFVGDIFPEDIGTDIQKLRRSKPCRNIMKSLNFALGQWVWLKDVPPLEETEFIICK